MRLSHDEHLRQLVQLHDETDEFYYIRLAALFEQDASRMIELYNAAKKRGWTRDSARTLVLTSVRVIPYERFLECYVLSGTTKFKLPDTTGPDSSAGSAGVAGVWKSTPLGETGDGPASTVPSSTEKTD